jgi:uncharacterized SAM-binding protein YcdF (DUF218 family)
MKNFLSQIPKAYRLSTFCFLGLLSIVSVSWKPIAINYGKWLAPVETNPTGDMSVLLSGSEARLETLIQLFIKGNVKAVYYAGGVDETPAKLESYRRIFAKYDLPNKNLYCGGLVRSTFEEAQAFQRTIDQAGLSIDQIVLVSDRYHLRRGIWTFEHILSKDIAIQGYATPSSPEIADPHWWKHKVSRNWVFGETKKLLFYQLYYSLLGSESALTHGDANRMINRHAPKGIQNPCQIVLPKLKQNSK